MPRRIKSLTRWTGIAIALAVAGVITVEFLSASARGWTGQHPFAMNVAADVLVVALTVLGLDVLLRRREEAQWRRRVAGVSGTWLQRANILVQALEHIGEDDEDAGIMKALYRQAGFPIYFTFGSPDREDFFSWLQPALQEWLTETRGMLPLLSSSPAAFEAASRLNSDFETCLGSFTFFERADDEDRLTEFLRDMHPLAERHLVQLLDILDFELVERNGTRAEMPAEDGQAVGGRSGADEPPPPIGRDWGDDDDVPF